MQCIQAIKENRPTGMILVSLCLTLPRKNFMKFLFRKEKFSAGYAYQTQK